MKRVLIVAMVVAAVCVGGAMILSAPSAEAAPPTCESRCQKKFDRCIRQGNDRNFCFDLVFCECMCNECNDCIC